MLGVLPIYPHFPHPWKSYIITYIYIYIYIYKVPYSENFSRTINFAVFVDFTATSKINPRKSYYSIQYKYNDNLVDPQNLIREMYH